MDASPSKLLHFLDCIRYWHEGAYGPAGAPAESGKEFHSAVADHAIAVTKDPSDPRTPMAFLQTMDDDIRKDCLDLLARYQSNPKLLPDPAAILSVEANDSTFMHPTLNKPIYRIDMGDGNFLTGIPDRVSMVKDHLVIDDWKTGFAIGDDPFQLSCYALLASDIFGVTKVKGRYNYIRLGISVSYWWDIVDIEHHRRRVQKMIQKMAETEKSGVFPENPCKSCGYCSLKSCCREYAKALADDTLPPGPSELMSVTDAVRLDKEMGGREKIFKKAGEQFAQTALAKIGKDGTVEGNTHFSVKEIVMRYCYDLTPVIQTFKHFGVVGFLDQVLEVSSTRVDMVVERQDLKDELGSRYEEFLTAILGLKKPKSTRRQIVQKPAGNPESLEENSAAKVSE